MVSKSVFCLGCRELITGLEFYDMEGEATGALSSLRYANGNEHLEAAATEKRQELGVRGWHRSGWSREQSFPSIDSVVSQALNERAQPGNVHDLARDLQSFAILPFHQ